MSVMMMSRTSPLMHDHCNTRPTVTFPAAGSHRFLTTVNLYCLVTGIYTVYNIYNLSMVVT